MTEKSKVFNQTRKLYMEKIAATDLNMTAEKLGMTMTPQGPQVKYFNKFHYIKENDIVDEKGNPVDFDALVALSKYILLCPDVPSLDRQWTAYRDFKNSGPLLKFFADAVEGMIASAFTNRLDDLTAAADRMGAEPAEEELSYDLKRRFQALPNIAMLLLFNDADSEFPAECRVLFERRAEAYLDMESVAILGKQLAEYLKESISQ
ncbi:MAG: DUF3786 domain-containing protein [Deltaproteobacteria bacterium]|nr:DUF3786 domain-containing protein [Deltaproteobacteria bacterium]